MQSSVRVRTTVLPGHRIDVAAPDLPEGADVELVVSIRQADPISADRKYRPMIEIAECRPVDPPPFGSWEAFDRFLQQEKDSWDR